MSSTVGDDAAQTQKWLKKEEEQLVNGWLLVPPDQRTGHVLQILTSAACGELTMVPFLPSYGLGESLEGPQKRANRGQSFGRRIRGFPNLLVGLQREMYLQQNIPELALPEKELAEKDQDEDIVEIPDEICMNEGQTDIQMDSSSPEIDLCAKYALAQFTDGEGNQPSFEDVTQWVDCISQVLSSAGEKGLSLEEIHVLLCENGIKVLQIQIHHVYLMLYLQTHLFL